MTVLVDTSVLVAAFLSRGVCHELIEHLVRHHEPIVSPQILEEFERVLTERFEVPARVVQEASALIASRFRTVASKPPFPKVCRDPGDDHVCAAALASGAEALVTGDKDLLELQVHGPTTVLKPGAFWEFELRSR